ncbi:MAG TPA: NAD-dependent epimerase/dehydratase family protein [Actinomycetota bacterium]|nr:NAD-dependent epimerase/dehydratase family protein [Actinomycetota bacterium]
MAGDEKRRVLVTGVGGWLGVRVAARLKAHADVGSLIGVDLDDPPFTIKGMEFIRADIRSPLIARVLGATKVDTIVHTNISSSPSRFGGRSQMKENNVIGTMQLLAAAQRADHVKKVVVKSSTAVYGSGPAEPSLIAEDHAGRVTELSGYGKDCADAETSARDFGRRRPDVELVILRTQNVIGPRASTSMSRYLSLPVVPTALGYDPRLQLLHEDDAVRAMSEAAMGDARGIFNIAGEGVVYLGGAIRLLGKVELPLLAPTAQLTSDLLRRFDLVDFPRDQLRLVLFGRVVDTRRAAKVLGFTSEFSTRACLEDFRRNRAPDEAGRTSRHESWERELFDYLHRKSMSGSAV